MASGSASIADQAPSETGSSRHSDVRRSLPIYPYKQTASEPVGTSSRSRIMQRGAPSQGKASVIWRAIHSAVGLVVTLIQTRSPRSIRTITKPHSSLKPMVYEPDESPAFGQRAISPAGAFKSNYLARN